MWLIIPYLLVGVRIVFEAQTIAWQPTRSSCTPTWRPRRTRDHGTDHPHCMVNADRAQTSPTSTAARWRGAKHIFTATRQTRLQEQLTFRKVCAGARISLTKFACFGQSRKSPAHLTHRSLSILLLACTAAHMSSSSSSPRHRPRHRPRPRSHSRSRRAAYHWTCFSRAGGRTCPRRCRAALACTRPSILYVELARGARHRRRCLTALILLLERAEAAAEAAADDPAEDAPAVDGCATRGTRLIRRMSVPDGHAVGRVSNVFLCSCRMYVYQEKKGRPPDSTRVARVPSPTSDPRPRRDRRGAGGGLGRDGPRTMR